MNLSNAIDDEKKFLGNFPYKYQNQTAYQKTLNFWSVLIGLGLLYAFIRFGMTDFQDFNFLKFFVRVMLPINIVIFSFLILSIATALVSYVVFQVESRYFDSNSIFKLSLIYFNNIMKTMFAPEITIHVTNPIYYSQFVLRASPSMRFHTNLPSLRDLFINSVKDLLKD